MSAPSQEDYRTVYSGRDLIGLIAVVADGFHAELPDGRHLGVFASQREAAAAISAACARPVEG